MSIFPELLIQFVMPFIATAGFAVIFNIDRRELGFCGLTGALGWCCYYLVSALLNNAASPATLLGTVVVVLVSRIFSYRRKTPVSLYLIPGIIPLVPGAGIYYTMYAMIISNDNAAAAQNCIQTFKLAGVIAIGILIVLSLPGRWFNVFKRA